MEEKGNKKTRREGLTKMERGKRNRVCNGKGEGERREEKINGMMIAED